MELVVGIVRGSVAVDVQRELGVLPMDDATRHAAQAMLEESGWLSWDPTSTFRAAVSDFCKANARLPEITSSDKMERDLAQGLNLVRRLRFKARVARRKGRVMDYRACLMDSVLDAWEKSTTSHVFLWWPKHEVWFQETEALRVDTGELPKFGKNSNHAVLARNLRRVQQRRFAGGRFGVRAGEIALWEKRFPGIWRLRPARDVYLPASSFVDDGVLEARYLSFTCVLAYTYSPIYTFRRRASWNLLQNQTEVLDESSPTPDVFGDVCL